MSKSTIDVEEEFSLEVHVPLFWNDHPTLFGPAVMMVNRLFT